MLNGVNVGELTILPMVAQPSNLHKTNFAARHSADLACANYLPSRTQVRALATSLLPNYEVANSGWLPTC